MKIFFIILFTIFFLSGSITLSQFQSDTRLTNDPAISYKCFNNTPGIAASGNNIHIVWSDYRVPNSNEQIFYKRSTDGGLSWGPDVQLTSIQSSAVYPTIAAFGSVLHVVWHDHRTGGAKIFYKRSMDNGNTWGPDVQLSFGTSSASERPSLAILGQDIHVVWQDNRDGNYEIYYSHSSNGGTSWQTESRITTNAGNSLYPSVYAPGQYVHVAWSDDRDGNKEIYYKRSTDLGSTWGPDTRLTVDSAESSYPSITVISSAVYVVWQDLRNGWDIYGKRSADGGATWSTDTRLTNDISNSFYPAIFGSGQNLHIVWQDVRDGNWEIYYKRSTDAGLTWPPDTRLTVNGYDSFFPSVAVTGTSVNILWQDNRDGNFEMYFKQDPTGNPVGITEISSEVLKNYSISQNYPNPFNPSTDIKFDVPKQSYIKIMIYDNLGKEISTLVNGQFNPGTYKVNWNASNYPSGVYFYRILSGNYEKTKKMILIK
jgi:hypothetical protein